MGTTKLVNIQGKGPVMKTRSGRFQVSIWRWTKIIPAPEGMRDLFGERYADVQRACIQFSRWNRGSRSWEETSIWCNVEDLRSLAIALDDLNVKDSSENSGQQGEHANSV